MVLEGADAPRQRRSRDTEPLRRSREAAVIDHRNKVFQCNELHGPILVESSGSREAALILGRGLSTFNL
jgi:hypothetical protein